MAGREVNARCLDKAKRAAERHVRKKYPGLGDDVYEDLGQSTIVDLLKAEPSKVRDMAGLAVKIVEKKAARYFARKSKDVALKEVIARESALAVETDTDLIDAKKLQKGFRTLEEQRAAVRHFCEAEFKSFVGRAWGGEGEAAWFRGDASASERAADRVAQDLIERLRDVLAEIGQRTVLQKTNYQDRQLWHFSTLLRPLAEDVQYKIWQPRDDVKFVDNFRSLLVAEHDHSNFFGLRRRPKTRELAIIGLLCGSYPGRVTKSVSVEKVLAAEMRAVSEARDRYGGLRDLQPRPRRRQRRRKLES